MAPAHTPMISSGAEEEKNLLLGLRICWTPLWSISKGFSRETNSFHLMSDLEPDHCARCHLQSVDLKFEIQT